VLKEIRGGCELAAAGAARGSGEGATAGVGDGNPATALEEELRIVAAAVGRVEDPKFPSTAVGETVAAPSAEETDADTRGTGLDNGWRPLEARGVEEPDAVTVDVTVIIEMTVTVGWHAEVVVGAEDVNGSCAESVASAGTD